MLLEWPQVMQEDTPYQITTLFVYSVINTVKSVFFTLRDAA